MFLAKKNFQNENIKKNIVAKIYIPIKFFNLKINKHSLLRIKLESKNFLNKKLNIL